MMQFHQLFTLASVAAVLSNSHPCTGFGTQSSSKNNRNSNHNNNNNNRRLRSTEISNAAAALSPAVQHYGHIIVQKKQKRRFDYYRQAGGPIDPTICALSPKEIQNLIGKRMQCRRARDYAKADSILDLMNTHGVRLNDKLKQWRADKRVGGGGGEVTGNSGSSIVISSISSSSRDPDMRNCNSLEEMVPMAYAHVESMSPRGLSAFWTLTSKFLRQTPNTRNPLQTSQMEHQLQTILAHTQKAIQSSAFGYRDLATTSLGLAKIVKLVRRGGRSKPRQILRDLLLGNAATGGLTKTHTLFRSIATASIPIRQDFDARSLSNLIYAFGVVECVPMFEDDGSTFFEILAAEAVMKLEDFRPQELSNLLWAYTKDDAPLSAGLFRLVADHITDHSTLKAYNGQDLANIVWAYATAKESHPKLFQKIAHHIVTLPPNQLNSFNGQDFANIVWSYATAREPSPELFKTVADHVAARGNHALKAFNPQNLANTVWAYATAKESHPKIFQKMASHIARLDNLVANTVWAYATAKESHPKLFQKMASHIARLDNLDAFNSQALANILWAYATSQESSTELFGRVGRHIIALDSLEGFTPQALSITAWAYATSRQSSPLLFEKLSGAAIRRQYEFTSQNIGNFLWSYATNGQMDERLFASFAPSVSALLGSCNNQELTKIAWAYAVVNVPAPSLFDDTFLRACLKKEEEYTREELGQLHRWSVWQEGLESGYRLPSSLREKCSAAATSRVSEPSSLQANSAMPELSDIIGIAFDDSSPFAVENDQTVR
eukprot:CAMPEP_0201652452 /NCGR_PEP_ID=MMETSP0493-20130528/44483_1 /ASSEMBLY_ACC=CAM_ASM_000838 /TAXON_ID=420259 /ORGANISM="Thalassiosira gravida, Strain GMp14c1" /LENGTH=779 /DNA_ID=CAMNT_0048128967 /DNA_START=120 /DNA_END=2459 /DNA_ORIENTATION=-